MAAIFCVELVSGYDDFSALGIYACIMIMKITDINFWISDDCFD